MDRMEDDTPGGGPNPPSPAPRSDPASGPNHSAAAPGSSPRGSSTTVTHAVPSKRKRGLGIVTPNACTECRKKRAKVRCQAVPPRHSSKLTCLHVLVRRRKTLRSMQDAEGRVYIRNPGSPVQGEPSLRTRRASTPAAQQRGCPSRSRPPGALGRSADAFA
jgi:hypothetical protein